MIADDQSISDVGGADRARLPQALSPARDRGWLRTYVVGKDPIDQVPQIPFRAIFIEWIIILVAVFAFCTIFLSLDDKRALPGAESEVFQSLDWTLVNSLRHFSQFPLWNPYIRTGFPLVADPFLHIYNPLVAVPVLALGVWDGFKIGLFLSFLAAALGGWWLGAVLGVRGVTRVWMALMYAFTGQGAGRFLLGQYDFVLGFAWLPWAVACTLLAMRTQRAFHIVAAVAVLALILFSGNFYYAFHIATVMILLVLVSSIGLNRENGSLRLRLRIDRVSVLLVIGILALGLTAVQWIPLVDFRSHFAKISDPLLTGSHNFKQIWLDYVSKDLLRPDLLYSPRSEFYAYTGIWPFLLLLMLPLGIRRANKQALAFLVALLLFSVAWSATRYMPWAGIFSNSVFLSELKHQTRMLVFGNVALVGLAGLGLDALWGRLPALWPMRRLYLPEVLRWLAVRLSVGLLLLFCVSSVADLFFTNRPLMRTTELYSPSYEVLGWLRQNDSSTFFVGSPHGWHGAVVLNGLRFVDAWYGLDLVMPTQGAINQRPVRARPNYVAIGNDRISEVAEGQLVKQFSQHSIYRLPNSLPYAFLVSEDTLRDPAGGLELQASDVRAVELMLAAPNRMEIDADGATGEVLVVLATNLPGWQVTVDGRQQQLVNVGGYLGVRSMPGRHSYAFSYASVSFKVGLAISILTLIGLIGLALSERWLRQPRRKRFRVDATYAGGVLHPAGSLELAEQTAVLLTIEEKSAAASSRPSSEGELHQRALRWAWILFGLGLVVYIFTRLWGIDRFPIYFFTDEATFALLAEELLTHGLRNAQGAFLPLYFEVAGNRWTPVLAVYTHLPAIATFGKSIIATRATSAMVTLLCPIAVSLTLKSIFRARYWWAGALLVAVVPTWFLHSRTAFEWLTMASCYACFILSYLLYRTRSPKFLFVAILFGAATFYNHASGQLVMAAVTLFLLVSDFRYHLKNWRTILLGLLLVAVLAIPVLRLQTQHPGAMMTHLRAIDSYWFRSIPLIDKLQQFASTYLYGLSPGYWFVPNAHDLIRHRMMGYGNLGFVMLPLVVIGALLCLWRVRSPAYRALLLAALAAPAGAATAQIAITRMMAFVPPICVIAGLGLDLLLEWVGKTLQSAPKQSGGFVARSRLVYGALALVVFAVLSGASLWMLQDALKNGPTWYNDYQLYGMQYGARQLFVEAIPEYLKAHPDSTVMVSPNWANGTDTFIRFFFPKEQQFSRIQMHDVRYYMVARRELSPNIEFVMTPEEYEHAKSSGRFKSVDVDRTVPYPDGRVGFYFARLAYADNLDEILAKEREERRRPVVEQIELDGQSVTVSHSQFDMGGLPSAFDGDAFTVVRGLEANPLVFDFTFPQPRQMSGFDAILGAMDFSLKISLYAEGAAEPVVYEQTFRGLPSPPTVEMLFDHGPESVSRARLEVLQLNVGDETHIHVFEMKFK